MCAKRSSKRRSKKSASGGDLLFGFLVLVEIVWMIISNDYIIRGALLFVSFIAIIVIAFSKFNKKRNPLKDVDMSEVDLMNSCEFINYCAYLLQQFGYKNIRVTTASGNQGVDILADNNGYKYAFQCKCYANKVGNTPVQEVYTGKAIYGCDRAVVVTNNYFTDSAVHVAAQTNVELWDRITMKRMLYQLSDNDADMI